VVRLALNVLFLAILGIAMAGQASAQEGYRFNAGDVLRISVWREEGLERELLIQPDGMISFPLANQIEARGRTAEELETEIARRLERFIPGPVVTVELIEPRGNVVYVIGEVNSPGAFQISSPTTVVQALSLAGGFTPFAGKGRIRIIRKAPGGETALDFDYNDVAAGRDLATNVELQAGDVVMVPGGSLF
jgi:polysaccharide biosynthesis/export protein